MLEFATFVEGTPYDDKSEKRLNYKMDKSPTKPSDIEGSLIEAAPIKFEAREKLYDANYLSRDFAPLLPIFNKYREMVFREYADDTGQKKANLLNNFLNIFGFQPCNLLVGDIRLSEGADQSEISAPYWNALDLEHRIRFYDICEKEVDTGNGVIEKQIDKVSKCSCSLLFNDTSVDGVAEGSIEIAPHFQTSRMYKNGTVPAVVLSEILAPIESLYTAYQLLARDLMQTTSCYYDKLEDANATSGSFLVTSKESGYLAQIHPSLSIVGTKYDFDNLRESFEKLGIYCSEGQKIVLDDDVIASYQASSMMSNLFDSGDGVSSTREYGCLMYFSWLAFSDFFMDSWRKFGGMSDWVRLIGSENVADFIGKMDTYAVVNVDGTYILVTSGGFLRITQGTVESIEAAEWMSLETVEVLCGIMSDNFSESVYNDIKNPTHNLNPVRNEDIYGQYGRFLRTDYEYPNDKRYRRIVQVMSYLYRICYDKYDETYNDTWLIGGKEETDMRYWLDYRSKKAYKYFGYYMDLFNDMEASVKPSSFAPSSYKLLRATVNDNAYNLREAVTMRKIINIMHTLFNYYDVKICETPLGRKKAPIMWSLDDVSKSESYKKLPKVKLSEDALREAETAMENGQ